MIHAAAKVHLLRNESKNTLNEYRRVNRDGTLHLAGQSAESGVRRFVFISSIKVSGESTSIDGAFRADDPPAPVDSYGISKLEAEEALQRLGKDTGMEVVIVRPVLVYGPGVGANFLLLMRLIRRGLPLPLAAVHNARSFVGLNNLVDLIVRTTTHSSAANQVFLVSDGEDISTTTLIHCLAQAMDLRPLLFPVPKRLLKLAATVVGHRDTASRLLGSLRVDIEKTRSILGWTPPMTMRSELYATVKWFLGKPVGGRV